jgi:hypothetical protein
MSLGQEPLVTVLTPVYNLGDFLAQCIGPVTESARDLSKVPETTNFQLGPCWRERMFRTNWSGILLAEDDESHGHCLHV